MKFIGVNFHPPACVLARSSHGSLRTLLASNKRGLGTIASHSVAMQVMFLSNLILLKGKYMK